MKLPSGLRLDHHPIGRHFLQIPGPTNVPDRVLRAIDHSTIDHRGPEFGELGRHVLSGIRKIFQTEQPVIIYSASGTGAWEAAFANTLSPGDRILMVETGHFAALWKRLAERLGLVIDYLPGDWRSGVDPNAIGAHLQADPGHAIRAVCVVHNETSTGITSDIAAVRRAIDGAHHPALLLVDTVSSIGSIDYRHDDWGVDVTVAGSQKGLMLPPGLGFNAISPKALAASRTARLPRAFWAWDEMLAANEKGYWPTTPSTNLLYGLAEAIAMLLEEGLPRVFERHLRHAEATRRAARAWGLEILCRDPAQYSPVVTTLLMPEADPGKRHDADRFRKLVLERFNMSLGTGLGKLAGQVFRLGHLGDFNDLSLIGTLGGVEMGLASAGIPHRPGGVQAAIDHLAACARGSV
ncbi:MAG: pyridoxal-phosphate-dependent aminotransferase family protein [Betaproteobacteria bacterium]